MWILSVVLLGMGGILREKAVGTSSLTLALPIGRMRIVTSRIGVGLLESCSLGIVPWLAVVGVMTIVGKPVELSQVTYYVVLLVAGGFVFFAMGILASSLVSGEYTAPALTFGIVLLVVIISDAWLREYSVWRLVTGDISIDRSTFLLPQHLPWLGILASLFCASLMMAAAVYSVHERDF
jgi:ABC-2 type transport system permease protein